MLLQYGVGPSCLPHWTGSPRVKNCSQLCPQRGTLVRAEQMSIARHRTVVCQGVAVVDLYQLGHLHAVCLSFSLLHTLLSTSTSTSTSNSLPPLRTTALLLPSTPHTQPRQHIQRNSPVMMNKSAFTTLLFLVALVALSSVAAQSVSPTTTAVTAQSPTTQVAVTSSTTGSAPGSTITAPSNPGSNFTQIPNFSSLASLIQSYASERSANPGNTPTSKPSGNSAAPGLLTEASRTGVMAGMGLVLVTALLAAVGTIGL